jgi:hypothetical protein
MTTLQLRLMPIDITEANRLRDRATVVKVADASPGYPCRQCLLDADIGEELVLVSFDPFTYDSPYRSSSPIFLHKNQCREPRLDKISDQQLRRQLSVRAFDNAEMMSDAEVIDGGDLEDVALRLFESSDVAFLHVHNASPGCWALRIERAQSIV